MFARLASPSWSRTPVLDRIRVICWPQRPAELNDVVGLVGGLNRIQIRIVRYASRCAAGT
jgi:hypothetical protein